MPPPKPPRWPFSSWHDRSCGRVVVAPVLAQLWGTQLRFPCSLTRSQRLRRRSRGGVINGMDVPGSSDSLPLDEEPGTPSPPAKKAKGTAWAQPTCKQATVVTGGLSRRFYVVETKEIECSAFETKTFVKVGKNEEWVLKLVLGEGGQRGGLKRTKLVEELRAKLVEEKGFASSPKVDDDPMNQLDELASVVTRESKRGYQRKRAKDKILTVEMPAHCQLGLNKSTEKARVEIMAVGTYQLWINMESVPWFISYLSAECRSGGVAHEDEGGDTPNCEVDGLHIAWDFDTNDAWVGTWLEGPATGHTVSISLSSFTESKFQQSAPRAGIATLFSEASHAELKQAARTLLVDHCAQVLASHRSRGDGLESGRSGGNDSSCN